jgi:hypothetical protein
MKPIIKFIVEKQWITKENYIATILMNYYGYRLAYITLPKDHKLENVKYTDSLLENVDVRNDLTYAGNHHIIFTELWTIGYDYMHYNDAPDITKANELFNHKNFIYEEFIENELQKQTNFFTELTDLKDIEKGLNSLSAQLSKL